MHDVIIIGAGAAGLTAGLYTARQGLSPLILSREVGGQTASTAEIENYPGVGRVEGPDLMNAFREQAQQFGARIAYEDVLSLQASDDGYDVRTTKEVYMTHALILTFGKTHRKLGVEGEDTFREKGIFYGTGPFIETYRDKPVAVVGGGNSAVQAAIQLNSVASHVYLIHRRDTLSAEDVLQTRLKACTRIEYVVPATVRSVRGSMSVESIEVGFDSGEERSLEVGAIFACIGFEMKTDLVAGLVERSSEGRIVVNEKCETSRSGIFAAGDVTTVPFQQIVISAGEGAKAGISAHRFVSKRLGKRTLACDWGFIGTH